MARTDQGTPPSESVASSPPTKISRKAAAKACDRCRRRKSKCDFDSVHGRCGHCKLANAACTYDSPTARRGPKAKRRATSDGVQARPQRGELPQISFDTPQSVSTLVFDTIQDSPEAGWAVAAPPFPIDGALRQSARANSFSSAPSGITARKRFDNLGAAISQRSISFPDIVHKCLDLFFEYLYPLTPLVHEPTLRRSLSYFLPPGSDDDPLMGGSPDAAFTLITAVCAESAFLLPSDIFPEGDDVADMFLHASRNCLNSYLEADIEFPNASSVTIRYFHSNCLHAAGKPQFSWHIFGEATRLAQVMNLQNESSYDGLYPIEAEMRRRVFWIVYMGDKSAAILNNRPITMHKYSYDSGITAAYPSGIEDGTHVDADMGGTEGSDKNLIVGFNANIRLWGAASDIMLLLRLSQDQHDAGRANADPKEDPGVVLTQERKEAVDALYVRFLTCLDDLPPFLQSYAFASVTGKAATQSKQYLTQCSNLQVSLHCLRMVITQKFEDIAYFAPGAEQADLRKTEIVRDMLRVIHEVPFWALQVNGEPYVEKIRLIGATLLGIIHRNPTSPIATRARGDFSILLDILTRLDSKASDALRGNSSWTL